MQRNKQFKPVVIDDFTLEKWQRAPHNHNHFEIIYIREGNGKHHLNDEIFGYEQDDVFILGPSDYHYFDIRQTTRFIYLKFTDFYISNAVKVPPKWLKEVESVLTSKSLRETKIRCSETDKTLVRSLFDVIITLKQHQEGNEFIIFFQIISLLAIIKRNLPAVRAAQNSKGVTGSAPRLEHMISYIHDHIHKPELLRIRHLAETFNMTESYVGAYFKRNMDMTLRAYITRYKQMQIESRVMNPDFTLKQIAADFGLTDESHFNKVFKKFKGVSPRAFRKQLPVQHNAGQEQ